MAAQLGKLLNMNVVVGVAGFTTTGTSVEVSVGPLTKLFSFVTFPIGTVAADEPISLDEALVDGGLAVSNTVTVKRLAGTTSGLKFAYAAYGY